MILVKAFESDRAPSRSVAIKEEVDPFAINSTQLIPIMAFMEVFSNRLFILKHRFTVWTRRPQWPLIDFLFISILVLIDTIHFLISLRRGR